MKKFLLGICSLCLLVSLPINLYAKTYIFGITPFKKPTELNKMFMPLIKYLEKELGAKVKFQRAKNYDDLIDKLVNGNIDISYLGPAPFAILDTKYPGTVRTCVAIQNNNKSTFKGVIITKKGSQIESLKDLKGKEFAFGDRKSTLSCYMPAYALMKAGVFDSLTYSFHGKHSKVVAAVYRNKADAGGLKPSVAQEFISKGYDIKVIAETDPVYEHMIVVGPSIDNKTYMKIKASLLKIKDPNIYKSIKKSLTGFTEVKSSNYDNLKKVIKTVDAKIK